MIIDRYQSIGEINARNFEQIALGLKEVHLACRYVYLAEGMRIYVAHADDGEAAKLERVRFHDVLGFVTVRDNDQGGKWIQAAWTLGWARKQGICTALLAAVVADYPGQRVGFGTQQGNVAMQTAGMRAGFCAETVAFYREPDASNKEASP